MKKLMKSLVLFAAAAMALTSCENEMMNEGIESNDTYTLTFTADAPESRTSVSIDGTTASFAWSEGDKVAFIQRATGDSVDKINKKNSSEAEIAADGTASFTSNFDSVEGATSFDYAAIYPADSWVSNTNFSEVNVKLPAAQALTKGTFDPKADLMMSQSILNVESKDGHGGNLAFGRLAAIGEMNLKLSGMTEGEIIKRVVISFNDVIVNGNVALNFTDDAATYAEEGGNSIDLSGELAANAEGTKIYFTCFPGEYTGAYSIDVTTDKATYSNKEDNKSISKALSFTAGNVLAFGATVGHREEIVVNTSGEVTIDFSNTAQRTSFSTEKQVWENEGVTLTNNKASSTSNVADYSNPARFYKSSNIVIDAPSNITKIVFTANNTQYASDLKNSAGEEASVSGSEVTIIPTAQATSYTITSLTAQVRVNSVTVTYGGEVTPTLATPENLTTEVDEDNIITITWNEVKNAENYILTVNDEEIETEYNSYDYQGDWDSTYEISVVAVAEGYNNSAAATTTVAIGSEGGDNKTYYVKVTTAPADWSGTYLIVYQDENMIFNGSLTTLDATSNYTSVTITDSKIEATTDMAKYQFTIATMTDGYSIQAASGKYIGHAKNENKLTSSDSALVNTISFNNADQIDIKCSGGAYLRFNTTSGQDRFRYFKSNTYTSQKAIQLYKLEN